MSKALTSIIASMGAVAMFASLAWPGRLLAAAPEPSQPVTGNNGSVAGSFISAIKDEQTSIIEAEPKCGYGTILTGTLVMETPRRDGFPFSATTFASPQGTFTTLTTTGSESEAVIGEVAKMLNTRADAYVKRLLRNCSL